MAVTQYQLTEQLKETQSFAESFQNTLQLFLKCRGRNFVFSVLAFVVVWLLMRYMYRPVDRYSSIHKSGKRTFYTRLFDVVSHVLSFVAATGALLRVLHVAADRVLLGLAILFLFGPVRAARQALPKFCEQGKFLLNLGTVREKGRIVYNGIRWKVLSPYFYTHLVNPGLKGGLIRLPLKELLDLEPRPCHPEEPSFPCKENDWVIVADHTRGKVMLQTPEIVELVVLWAVARPIPRLNS